MMLSGNATLAAVIGWPVGHSLSPRLHGYWLERYGIDGAYVPLAVAPDDFKAVARILPWMGFAGANVTVPHKRAALAAVDEADETARRIGAVNTIICRPDGTLLGQNTDGFGFLENIESGCPGWDASGQPAVVLGAGGAARAIVASLLDAGVSELRLANRTESNAAALAADIGGAISIVGWDDAASALDGAGLLVNTTTLGMAGKPPLELSLDALPGGAVVTDTVYSPLETPLLHQARARGNPAVDGLGMLLHQARPGFAAWFGTEPEVTEDLRSFVLGQSGA
jgi:shikimate dehydrogenase